MMTAQRNGDDRRDLSVARSFASASFDGRQRGSADCLFKSEAIVDAGL
jgi:hypothetical protein